MSLHVHFRVRYTAAYLQHLVSPCASMLPSARQNDLSSLVCRQASHQTGIGMTQTADGQNGPILGS